MCLAEVEKRGSAELETMREENAVPTSCRFDFTLALVSGFRNGNERVQRVTNSLKMKSGTGRAGGAT
jgi:hypothetical protein